MKSIAVVLLALSLFLGFSASQAGAADKATGSKNDFTLCAGDVLQISIWKEDGLDRETLVLPDGSISFPLIGSLPVQGKTLAGAQDAIKEKLQPIIPDAAVMVVVKAPLGHTASVLGQVMKPGEFVMNHQTTVMQALSQAGGLTPYASEGNIIVLRHASGKEIALPYPYSDIAAGDNLDQDFTLVPGDVVMVPTAGLF